MLLIAALDATTAECVEKFLQHNQQRPRPATINELFVKAGAQPPQAKYKMVTGSVPNIHFRRRRVFVGDCWLAAVAGYPGPLLIRLKLPETLANMPPPILLDYLEDHNLLTERVLVRMRKWVKETEHLYGGK